MLTEFEKKIVSFIQSLDPFCSAKKVLLAVSGGADSTALIYLASALQKEGILSADFICAHINHQLRSPDADLDENFVVTQAESLNFPVVTRKIDVRRFAQENKLSIETAARQLRLKNLLDIAKSGNCTWIATAHQKNDNAETLLQRLTRGTGFRGLAGIWPVRTFPEGICFVRPLLCVGRDEIVEYLRERNLQWRLDRTNEDCRYRRNFIRHRLIPELQKQSGHCVIDMLSELAQTACNFHNLVRSFANKVWPQLADCAADSVSLDLKLFLSQPPPVKIELICRSLFALGSGEGNLSQQHLERILQLSERNISNRKIKLPGSYVVHREYGKLVFVEVRNKTFLGEKTGKAVDLKIPGQTRFGDYFIEADILNASQNGLKKFKAAKTKFVEWFDLDRLQLPLKVRLRRSGDRFIPLGLTSGKKVGKFLTAAKVQQELRRNLLIVADSKKIVWVYPVRISQHAKVTDTTEKILQLQIAKVEEFTGSGFGVSRT